jgi:hypothetical protein
MQAIVVILTIILDLIVLNLIVLNLIIAGLIIPSSLKSSMVQSGARVSPGKMSYARAITSISNNTSLGSRATSTVERAGGETLKYFP